VEAHFYQKAFEHGAYRAGNLLLDKIINAQNKSNGFTALHHFLLSFWEFKRHGLYSEEKMSDWRQLVWLRLRGIYSVKE